MQTLRLICGGLLAFMLAGCAAPPAPIPFDPTAAVRDLPITVDPDQWDGECPLPFRFISGSDYMAFLSSRSALSADGVIQYNYAKSYDNAGLQFTSQHISSFGMTAVNAWCQQHDLKALQLAVNQGEWLVRNIVPVRDFGVWLYRFPVPAFFMQRDFTSGLGNGSAIVLLTQLYLLSGDQRYLDTARLALGGYETLVEEGGVRNPVEDGQGVFFEEYAQPGAPFSRVLNGHIVAVAALDYHAQYTQDQRAARLAQEGIDGVRHYLPAFDVESMTRYSLGPIPFVSTRQHYSHRIHLEGVYWMYEKTGDPVFLDYAFRWQWYKWPGLDGELFYDRVSDETLMTRLPDVERRISAPREAKTFILRNSKPDVPVRSFSYVIDGPYPTDYTVAISNNDGKTWDEIARVTGANKPYAVLMLDDRPVPLIRLTLDKLVDDNPLYAETDRGVYADRLLVGVFRLLPPDAWEDPILLVTDGDIVLPDAERLRDGDATTSVRLPDDGVIYGDLRLPGIVTGLTIDGEGQTERRLWIEVSDDLQTWMPLISSDAALDVTLPGTVRLPSDAHPYHYFRLYLEGSGEMLMTEVTIRRSS